MVSERLGDLIFAEPNSDLRLTMVYVFPTQIIPRKVIANHFQTGKLTARLFSDLPRGEPRPGERAGAPAQGHGGVPRPVHGSHPGLLHRHGVPIHRPRAARRTFHIPKVKPERFSIFSRPKEKKSEGAREEFEV